MDINCNKVANGITTNKPSIPLVNTNNDANEFNSSFQIPNLISKNLAHLYINNQHATNKKKFDKLRLYHQNIRGLNNKTEELTTQGLPNSPIYSVLLNTILMNLR
jgi:hypothetical protein